MVISFISSFLLFNKHKKKQSFFHEKMLLYEDYFSCNTSQSSLLDYSKFDARIYDIIFLSPSHTQQTRKQQWVSTIQWLDGQIVSRFESFAIDIKLEEFRSKKINSFSFISLANSYDSCSIMYSTNEYNKFFFI